MLDNWQIFAEKLFRLEDADPMYYALERVDFPLDYKYRFMVGWITYYHPGIAASAARYTGERFWSELVSHYATAKRASERRHFRGEAGMKALKAWSILWPEPERMIPSLFGSTYFEVRSKARVVPQIGDYFVWKLADVQERVFHVPCDFTGAEKWSPKVPQEGAKLISTAPIEQVYAMIVEQMQPRMSPPAYDRPINMQEAETVCCVYHQYRGGGYTYGSRTAKAHRRLSAYESQANEAMLDALHMGLPYQPPAEEE